MKPEMKLLAMHAHDFLYYILGKRKAQCIFRKFENQKQEIFFARNRGKRKPEIQVVHNFRLFRPLPI